MNRLHTLEEEGKCFKATSISPFSRRVRATAYNPRANGGRTWVLTFRSTQSSKSWKTFEEVARMMDKEKDFLVFLTVVSLTSAVGVTTITYAEMSAHVRQKCEKKFRGYMGLCHQEKIRHFTFVLGVSSKPGKKICQVAREYDADCIVLGTPGARKSSRRFSGLKSLLSSNTSVLDYVHSHSHCEVLEVNEDPMDAAHFRAPPNEEELLEEEEAEGERGAFLKNTDAVARGVQLEERADQIDYHWEVALREITHIR